MTEKILQKLQFADTPDVTYIISDSQLTQVSSVVSGIPTKSLAAVSGGTGLSLVTTGEKYNWNNKSTYESKAAVSGGTDLSLVTTGEKYNWNNKSDLKLGTTSTTAASGNHTHKYAASDKVNGSALSGYKLTTSTGPFNIGSSTNPVYFSNGVPVACTYTIEKSVPSTAVFTDTTYESKAAVSSGTELSLVTTGEKYNWNNKADLASPIFTGIPTVPSAADGTNSTQIANTAFVQSAVNTKSALSTVTTGSTLKINGHYRITMTSNTTLNAEAGTAGYTGAAEIFINPGSYTFTAGTNMVLVNTLQLNKTNYCTLNWYGTTCRMYVVDSWE